MTTRGPNAEWAALHHERGHASLAPSRSPEPLDIIEGYLKGEHPVMRDLRSRIARHATGSSPVLLTGETGTGKQQAARALHAAGPRRAKRLVLASVASLSGTLAQSELYGHRRGAFTGADRDRKGFFIEARGSTLVLDDIPDFPFAVQAMLLSSIEYGIVRPLGSDGDEESDARVVATANRSLPDEVGAGRFREDLYHRLSTGEIRVPPLREHLTDVAIYAEDHLLRVALGSGYPPRTLSDGALNALSEYGWPGNVRELQNVLRRATHATNAETLEAEDVLREMRPSVSLVPRAELPAPAVAALDVVEEQRIREALEATHWNVSCAARFLGIGRTWIYQLIRKYDLSRPSHKTGEQCVRSSEQFRSRK